MRLPDATATVEGIPRPEDYQDIPRWVKLDRSQWAATGCRAAQRQRYRVQ